MRKNLLVRSVLILVVILVSILSVWSPGKGWNINLALDLQGGVMFVLRVDTKDAVAAETSQYAGYLRTQVQDEGIADAVSMCRPFIMDQHIVKKFRLGLTESSNCTSCNRCIDEMHKQNIHCIFNQSLILP